MEHTVVTSRRQIRRTSEEINSILVSYESSGLSMKEFCKRHQIKVLYLTRWLKRYRSANQTKGFVELRPGPEPTAPMAGLFAEYRGIHFYQPVDPSYLKTLLS